MNQFFFQINGFKKAKPAPAGMASGFDKEVASNL